MSRYEVLWHDETVEQRIEAGIEKHRKGDATVRVSDALDSYNGHDRPLHISEITLPCPSDDRKGREIQARMTRDVYRLFFSQKMAHAVTWWNFPDGGAVPGEDKVLSGLVERDMSPKPAYEAMEQLINHDWRTNVTVKTNENGEARFRGFGGRYRITCGGAVSEMELANGTANEYMMQCDKQGSKR